MGGKGWGRQRLGHELEGGRRGTRRMLVGQRIEGLQSRWRGEVGRHLRERCSRLVWHLFV